MADPWQVYTTAANQWVSRAGEQLAPLSGGQGQQLAGAATAGPDSSPATGPDTPAAAAGVQRSVARPVGRPRGGPASASGGAGRLRRRPPLNVCRGVSAC